VFANEIDNMALIMPSQDKHAAVAAPVVGKTEAKAKGKKRSPKKMEMTASLNVACLKRLLPIGLNMFGGREQELIQQSKQMLIDVSIFCLFCACVREMRAIAIDDPGACQSVCHAASL